MRCGSPRSWRGTRARDEGWLVTSAQQRTQALIDRGRRSAARARMRKSRKALLTVAGVVAVIVLASVFIFRSGPGWPPSVATVQSQIETACQNPNIASEPAQVNFACGKDTRQILWVSALMTSGDNPQYSDPKTGRQGLEPITPTQGGQVAWSLNMHSVATEHAFRGRFDAFGHPSNPNSGYLP